MSSYPSNKRAPIRREREIKTLFGNIPDFLSYSINFCFNVEALSARRSGLLVQHRVSNHAPEPAHREGSLLDSKLTPRTLSATATDLEFDDKKRSLADEDQT
jgi:hypothetical protein